MALTTFKPSFEVFALNHYIQRKAGASKGLFLNHDELGSLLGCVVLVDKAGV